MIMRWIMQKIKQKWNHFFSWKYSFYLIFGIAYFALHLVAPRIADDISTYDAYQNVDFNLNFLLYTAKLFYFEWSSRILINMVMYVLTMCPMIIWGVLDTLVILLIIHAVCALFPPKNRWSIWLWAGLFPMFSFIDLGGTGFIAVTVTYLWPLAFGLYAMIPLKKVLSGEKVKSWQYLAAVPALVFAVNEELIAGVCLAVFGICVVWMLTKRRRDWYPYTAFLITAASLIFTMTCPGNANRKAAEIANYYEGYETFSVIDKVRMGYYSAGHFLLTNSNWIFLICMLILVLLIFRKYQNRKYRLVSLIPLLIGLFLGPFGFLTNLVSSAFTRIPDGGTLYGNAAEFGTVFVKRELFLLLLITVAGVSVLCSLYWAFEDKKKSVLCMLIILLGFATRGVMGFSPTVWISGERTYFYLSFSLMFLGYILFDALVEYPERAGEAWFVVAVGYYLPFKEVAHQLYFLIASGMLYLRKMFQSRYILLAIVCTAGVLEFIETFKMLRMIG